MGMRRDARKHDTLAVQHESARTEDWWEHRPGDRVRTIDGPGRVVAVHDGPFPGSEAYDVTLEGGLGGGVYGPGQITAATSVEATDHHTADKDYPELGTLLHDRPDPATMRHTANLENGLGLVPAAPVVDDGEGQIMRDMGEYHSNPVGGDSRLAARAFDHYHPDQTYLRFGGWPKDERSGNNVTGFREDGVSVYDLDHKGEPMDPDPDLSRGHEHSEHCEPDCDLDSWNDDYGNDAGQEMRDRTHRAERMRRRGVPQSHPDVGHLVKGEMVGIGHDGEPLLNNVRRVGDWMDHRHLFVPGAQPHHLARTPDDDDYEHPEEKPTPHTARSINGEEIDDHGSAPGWHRAANPNVYDRQSTEGEPDPAWIEDIDKRQKAMASHPGDPQQGELPLRRPGDGQDEDFDERGLCAHPHDGACPDYSRRPPEDDSRHHGVLHVSMPSKRHPEHPEGFSTTIRHTRYGESELNGHLDGDTVGGIDYHAYDRLGNIVDPNDGPSNVHALKVNMLHTDGSRGRGVASALMDHLYTKHPNAWINHGYRTHDGLRWWNSYDEPQGHEGRNIHNVHPRQWEHIFDKHDVAGDIQRNEENDPGHHSDEHDVDWATGGDYDGEYRDEDEDESEEKPEPVHHDPDPRKASLAHGTAVHLSPADHSFVHDPSIPSEARAHRLLDAVGRGDIDSAHWYKGRFRADASASVQAEGLSQKTRHQHPPTHVTMLAHPFDHDEIHTVDSEGDHHPLFETDSSRGAVDFDNVDHPINFHLKAMSWQEHPGQSHQPRSSHSFSAPEPVGMPLKQYEATSHLDATRDNERVRPGRAQTRQEHQRRYAPRPELSPSPQAGEQMELFRGTGRFPHQRVSSLPSIRTVASEHVRHHEEITDPDELASHMEKDHGWSWGHLDDDDEALKADHATDHKDQPVSLGHHHGEIRPEDHWCQVHEEYHDDPAEAESHLHDGGTTDWGHHAQDLPDEIHRGMHVQLPPEVHAKVHDASRSTHERAEHLLNHLKGGIGIGMHWSVNESQAEAFAEESHHDDGRTRVTMTAETPHPEHIEDDPEKLDGAFHFSHDEGEVPLKRGAPLRLKSISWNDRPHVDSAARRADPTGRDVAKWVHPYTHHHFEEPHEVPVQESLFHATAHRMDPVGDENMDELARHMVEDHGHHPGDVAEALGIHRGLDGKHEQDHDEYQGLHPEDFQVQHHHAPPSAQERAFGEPLEAPQDYHPAWGGAAAPDPFGRLMTSLPVGVTQEDAPGHPSHLSLLVTAATDREFRFHVTAAWRDVQAKAKRIRSEGGVHITHADEGVVYANVKGDHNVYETGLQRLPGRRQSVATYTCGCKWGAYHWGASDDLSRFAGRMCSHALALQYEASSRGMFGRDVEADDAKPRWVPSKVVVKYDIDSGQHVRSTAALTERVVPEQAPIMVALALMEDGGPAARVVTAAANDMFGDSTGYSEPSLMNPQGPTMPWNPDDSPASAGPLSGGEPSNWGNINGPSMFPRMASALSTEGFWQAIVPLVKAVAPKILKAVAPAVIDKAVNRPPSQEPQEPEGTQAVLHGEPEGALPETDGEDHTASLGDVDIVNDPGLASLPDDALSPENLSIQTQGSAQDIVAEFQRSAAAQTLMSSGPKGDTSNSEIAQAAEAYLAKTAATAFTRSEQDALINESPGVQASNTDRLDIAGTHYADLEHLDQDEESDTTWLM
jgi:hypothetical protein